MRHRYATHLIEAGFEAVLLKLQAGLSKPRGTQDVAKIMERLGRAKQRYSRASAALSGRAHQG